MKKLVRPTVVYPHSKNERAFLEDLLRRLNFEHADLTRSAIEDFALGHLMSKADQTKKVSSEEIRQLLRR